MPHRLIAQVLLGESSVLAPSLHLVSITGAGAILVTGNNESFAMVGVLITSLAGLIAQVIKNRNDTMRDERRHRFDMEERAQTASVRASIDSRLADAKRLIQENTELTRETGERAQVALAAANHVNQKIATIAEIAASGRAAQIESTLVDTNDTAHRIEATIKQAGG